MNLTDFKNDLLFNAIHKEERSDSFRDKIKEAEMIHRYYKREPFDGDSSYIVYITIVNKIIFTKKLIELCNELQSKNYRLQRLVQVKDTYYQDLFKNRINDAIKDLRKLRPYVLEYCKDMKQEVRNSVIEKEETGKYFKRWFNN